MTKHWAHTHRPEQQEKHPDEGRGQGGEGVNKPPGSFANILRDLVPLLTRLQGQEGVGAQKIKI